MLPDTSGLPFINNDNSTIAISLTFSILLLFTMARGRIKPHLKKEWSMEYHFQSSFRKNITNTLGKLYSNISSSNTENLALLIRDEITSNAAIIFEQSPLYFIRHRRNPNHMKKFFTDPELLLFMSDPKMWSQQNGGINKSLFRKDRIDYVTNEYMENLSRIMEKFSLDVIRRQGNTFKQFSQY